MTTRGDPRTGRAWMALAAAIIARDHGICWRCGHTGADTCGHVLPWKTHPWLALDPDNLRAEHGRKRTTATDGYDCRGNYSYGADAGRVSDVDATTTTPRRDWFGTDTK